MNGKRLRELGGGGNNSQGSAGLRTFACPRSRRRLFDGRGKAPVESHVTPPKSKYLSKSALNKVNEPKKVMLLRSLSL